jgi:hypothetical protein
MRCFVVVGARPDANANSSTVNTYVYRVSELFARKPCLALQAATPAKYGTLINRNEQTECAIWTGWQPPANDGPHKHKVGGWLA